MILDGKLFNEKLLKELDYSNTDVYLTHRLSASFPGENLIMRPLCRNDFKKNYIELLSQLTHVGETTEEQFCKRFDSMKECKDVYYVLVMEDIITSKIIASGSLIIENHLSADLKTVQHGRIEDIVVSRTHRKRQLGKLLLESIVLLAKHIRCNRISLECKDPLVKFYTQFYFEPQTEQRYLSNRYKET